MSSASNAVSVLAIFLPAVVLATVPLCTVSYYFEASLLVFASFLGVILSLLDEHPTINHDTDYTDTCSCSLLSCSFVIIEYLLFSGFLVPLWLGCSISVAPASLLVF